jgi:hypothetical protein
MQKVGIPIAVLFMWNGVVCDTPLCCTCSFRILLGLASGGGVESGHTHMSMHAASDPCMHASSGSGAHLSYLSDHKDGSVTT